MTILLRTAIADAASHAHRLACHFAPRFLVFALVFWGGTTFAEQPSPRAVARAARIAQTHGRQPALPQPEPVPAPSQATKTHRFVPISDVTLDIGAPPGLLPQDLAAEAFGRQPPMVISPSMPRSWPAQVFCWYGVPLQFAPIHVRHSRAPGAMPCTTCIAGSRGDEIPVEHTNEALPPDDDKASDVPRPDDGSSRE